MWKRNPLTEKPEPYGTPEIPPPNPASPPYPYSYPPGPAGQYSAPYQSDPYQQAPYQSHPYQQGPNPGAYPPPSAYGTYPGIPTAPRNGLGIAALVTAIVAMVATFTIFGGIALGIVAVILGFVARGRVKRGEADNGGVALTGIILGVVAILVSVALIFFWGWLFKSVGGSDYVDCVQRAGQDQAKIEQCSEDFRQSLESRFSTQTKVPSR